MTSLFFVYQYIGISMFIIKEIQEKVKKKETLGYWTAILAFSFGWVLTIAGFIVSPVGEVDDSVLWILGQALLYTGAVVGITQHYSTELRHFKHEIAEYVNEEERKRYSNNTIDSDSNNFTLDDSAEEET